MTNDENQLFGLAETIGTTGLKHTGGFLYEEFLARLQGLAGVKVYREMVDNSSTIGAIRFLIKLLVRQVEWRLEPANESADAKMQAEFIDGCFHDMAHTFEVMIEEALTSLDYGWAYMEKVLKLRKGKTGDKTTHSKFKDGKWGWSKIQLRGQDTLYNWEIADDGEILGMHQLDSYAGKQAYIPMPKAMLFRTEAVKNNPEGRSLYRNAVVDHHSLKRVGQIELVGIERDMTGVVTMRVPIEILSAKAGTDEYTLRQNLERMGSAVKRDERDFIMYPPKLDRKGMPTGWDIELMTTGGRRQHDTVAIKRAIKISILQTVLAQFIELGMDKAGSWALVSSHTNTFSLAMGAIMDGVICEPFNNDAIPALCELNGFDPENNPSLVHGDIETPNLEEVGKYVTALASAGFDLSDPAIERKLLEIGDLPLPKDDEDHPEPDAGDDVEPDAPTAEDAEVRFTGVQITSTMAIIQAVAARQLPRENGIELMVTTLGLDREQSEKLMGSVGTTFFVEAEGATV